MEGSTAVCIATGPSLTRADCEKARQAEKVIAINDAFRWCPDADVLYACDRHWWERYLAEVRQTFTGELWTQYEDGKTESEDYKYAVLNGLHPMPGKARDGLGVDVIHYGNNSGYQAINLAWHLWKPTTIKLIGYDMGLSNDGKRHFFGNHPDELNAQSDYRTWIPKFNKLAEDLNAQGVDVVNCSRQTALTAFRRGEL